MIQRLLLGSGRERCDLELAVEARRRKEEGGGRKEEGGGQADVKSHNPHLTGGEKQKYSKTGLEYAMYCLFCLPLQL